MNNELFNDRPFPEALVYKKGMKEDIVCHKQMHCKCSLWAPPHHHPYMELLYCIGNSFSVRINNKIFMMEKGDFVIIPSNDIHSIIANNNTKKGGYIVIRVEPKIIYDATKDFNEISKFLYITTNSNNLKLLFKENEIKNSGIPSLIKNTLKEYSKRDYGYNLSIHIYICKIFLWILKYWNSFDSENHSLSYEKKASELTPALTYIQENYKSEINAEEMAELCNLSYSYFSRIFKSSFKKNFSDYINELRITEAEKLLLTTDMTVTEIGFEVGFSTTSYFIYQFKKLKNVSPKQYKLKVANS